MATSSRPTGTAATAANPLDPSYVSQQLNAYYQSLGLTPGGRGSGAVDTAYYTDEIINTGGWTTNTSKGENNIGYWQDRIKQDAIKGGLLNANGTPASTTGSSGTPSTSGSQPASTVLGTASQPNPIDPRTGRPAGASAHPAPGGSTNQQSLDTQQAYTAALIARRRAGAGGRASTIFAGFGAAAPTTQPATVLGS